MQMLRALQVPRARTWKISRRDDNVSHSNPRTPWPRYLAY
jgi:hypothetical protein